MNFYQNEALAFENQRGFIGEDMNAVGLGLDNTLYANGAVPAADVVDDGVSDPFIITLNNTTGAAITSVTVFNAAAGINAFNDGVTAGVVVTYGYSNLTYEQFLFWLIGKTFKVSAIQVITTTNAQAIQAMTVTTRNMTGAGEFKTIIPKVDPYQQQTGNIYQKVSFAINNLTTITLASLGAGLTVTYYFYPSVVERSFGRANTYRDPNVVRPLAISAK